MFTGSLLAEEGGKKPEASEKTVLQKAAEVLWATTNFFERQRNEMEARRHPPDRGPDPDYDAGLRDLENIRKVIRDELREIEPSVNFGNQGSDPRPEKNRRDQLAEAVSQLIQKLLILAIGFAFGALWNHETRISHLEGREKTEVPNARSP